MADFDMLAHLQKFIGIGIFAAAAVTAWALSNAGHFLLAGLASLAVLFSYALVLAAEFAMLYAVGVRALPHRPRVVALVRALALEIITTPRVFFWWQPFFSRRHPDVLSLQPVPRRGVVLVHGLFCNRGFWNPWLARLRAEEILCVAVNLEPIFASIDQYEALIESAVVTLESATGAPVIMVGHSMGGLAIRAWLRARAAHARVHHLVTIGTPHLGTWLARHSTATNGKQMRIGSRWLARLSSLEPTWCSDRVTCFYSDCDNIVFPMTCATLDGARNIHVPGLGHVRLAFEASIIEMVCNLAASPAGMSEQKLLEDGTQASLLMASSVDQPAAR